MGPIVASHELLPKGLQSESPSVESGRVSIREGAAATRCVCPVSAGSVPPPLKHNGPL
jgi:hypothetical protein